MGRSIKTPGLIRRGSTWHIDKQVKGFGRLCESTGTGDRQEAERYLVHRLEQIRQALVYGVRPYRTFREAATKYMNTTEKRSLARDALDLKTLDPFIGELPLDRVHMGTLERFIAERRQNGVKGATVNRAIAVVRRILNLASRLWRDEYGLTWLHQAPMLAFVKWNDVREPYPMQWDEQTKLFQALPAHLASAVLFKVNTGCREQEVCQLRWEWEVEVAELNTSVFVIPGSFVKNGEARVVVLNRVATRIVNAARGEHPEFVFSYRGKPLKRLCTSAWQRARRAAGLSGVRIHDLKHTFGRRLRAAGVPEETRKVLLGHKNGDITVHYSVPELKELLEAVNKLCDSNSRISPAVTLLKCKTATGGLRNTRQKSQG